MNKRKLLRNMILLIAIAIFIGLFFFRNYHYYLIKNIAVLFIPALILAGAIYKDKFELVNFKTEYDLYKTSNTVPINLLAPLSIVVFALAIIALWGYQVTNKLLYFLWVFTVFSMLTFLAKFYLKRNGSLGEIAGLMIFYSLFVVLYFNELGPITNETLLKGTISAKFRQIKGLGYTFVIGENLMENRVGVSESEYDKYEIGMDACAKDVTGWIGVTTRTFVKCGTD